MYQLKGECGLCSETWVPASHDRSQDVGIKVDEVTDIKVAKLEEFTDNSGGGSRERNISNNED